MKHHQLYRKAIATNIEMQAESSWATKNPKGHAENFAQHTS
jgi:hypothetical protein